MARKANQTTETVVETVVEQPAVEVIEPVEETRLERVKRMASEAADTVTTKAKDFGTWIMDTLKSINWSFAGALALVSAVFAFALAGIAALLGLSAGLGMAIGAGAAALFGIVKRDELATANTIFGEVQAAVAAAQ